mmetsp:Transcript_38494/g.120199  ORF Transcript_38494/g.120199 Transcript_38494/m.120199 type:complete len:353 (-) Transcript_38494:398-1456(-)
MLPELADPSTASEASHSGVGLGHIVTLLGTVGPQARRQLPGGHQGLVLARERRQRSTAGLVGALKALADGGELGVVGDVAAVHGGDDVLQCVDAALVRALRLQACQPALADGLVPVPRLLLFRWGHAPRLRGGRRPGGCLETGLRRPSLHAHGGPARLLSGARVLPPVLEDDAHGPRGLGAALVGEAATVRQRGAPDLGLFEGDLLVVDLAACRGVAVQHREAADRQVAAHAERGGAGLPVEDPAPVVRQAQPKHAARGRGHLRGHAEDLAGPQHLAGPGAIELRHLADAQRPLLRWTAAPESCPLCGNVSAPVGLLGVLQPHDQVRRVHGPHAHLARGLAVFDGQRRVQHA